MNVQKKEIMNRNNVFVIESKSVSKTLTRYKNKYS